MTTNLFVIANVKQLRTDGRFSILLPFFRTSLGVGLINSAIFNSFYNRVEFGTIWEGLRNFGEGGLNPPKPPSVRHCLLPCADVRNMPLFLREGFTFAYVIIHCPNTELIVISSLSSKIINYTVHN